MDEAPSSTSSFVAGVTLNSALTRFASDQRAARRFRALVLDDERTPEQEAQRLSLEYDLEQQLRARIEAGDLRAAGFRDGEITLSHPATEWWADARFDYQKNTAAAHGTSLFGVRVVWLHNDMPLPPPKAKRGPVNYQADDDTLIKIMKEMVDKNEASGPWDAARAVVLKARGKGNDDSKIKRLTRLFGNRYTQSGQY